MSYDLLRRETMSEPDPELINNLNLLFRILKQIDEEEMPPICVNEHGIYYPTAIEGKEKEVNELQRIANKLLGDDDYVGPIAIYGVNAYTGEPYVCIINPTHG